MKYPRIVFGLFSFVFLTSFSLMAQEETEKPVQEEAVTEEVEEAVEEEAITQELEFTEEEEAEEVFKEKTKLAGFTAGLLAGYPVYSRSYYKDNPGPVVGLVIGTPFGFSLGPLPIGFGVRMENVMTGSNDPEIGLFGTANITAYQTPSGFLSLFGGGGYLGGVGIIGGASFDYSVPNSPITVVPFVRGTARTIADDETVAGTWWFDIGAVVSYDLSSLKTSRQR